MGDGYEWRGDGRTAAVYCCYFKRSGGGLGLEEELGMQVGEFREFRVEGSE